MPDGPNLTIDLDKIEHNARTITALCAARGIGVCGVTKVTCGMPQVARALLRGGVTAIGESRMKNIHRLKANGVTATYMLLRIPPLSAVDDIVTSVNISLNSELSTIAALSEAAFRRGLAHRIILMVDLGDLREGVWPDDLIPVVREVLELPGIRLAGLGTNLSCYGGVIPSVENMNQLVDFAHQIEDRFQIRLEYISGGNSSALDLIAAGRMPAGVNHIRIGEGILLGRETVHRRPVPGTFQDAFLLRAEVIELKEKPSLPIGETGEDAFGGKPVFVDRGERDRAILNIGREDVYPEGMTPADDRLAILGASSDHLIVDVTDARAPVRLGDELPFFLNYSALLAAMTSAYVDKRPLRRHQLETGRRSIALLNLTPENAGARGRILNIRRLVAELHALGYAEIRQHEILPAGPDPETAAADPPAFDPAEAAASEVREIIDTGQIALVYAHDPAACLGVYRGIARAVPFLGIIVLSAHGGLRTWNPKAPSGRSVLSAMLAGGGLENPGRKLESERMALVGLREVSPAEAERIRATPVTTYTMEDIDALGMREVIYRAIHAASLGADGIHVTLDLSIIDPTVAPAVHHPVRGGLSYREGHLIMEMIARSDLLRSIAIVNYLPDRDPDRSTARTATEYALSLFGKKILGGRS